MTRGRPESWCTASPSSRASRLSSALPARADRQVPVFGLPGHPAAVSYLFRTLREAGPAAVDRRDACIPRSTASRRTARSGRGWRGALLPRRAGKTMCGSCSKRRRTALGPARLRRFGPHQHARQGAGTVVVPVNKIGIEAGEEVDVDCSKGFCRSSSSPEVT